MYIYTLEESVTGQLPLETILSSAHRVITRLLYLGNSRVWVPTEREGGGDRERETATHICVSVSGDDVSSLSE